MRTCAINAVPEFDDLVGGLREIEKLGEPGTTEKLSDLVQCLWPRCAQLSDASDQSLRDDEIRNSIA